jgi:hypothetical protein
MAKNTNKKEKSKKKKQQVKVGRGRWGHAPARQDEQRTSSSKQEVTVDLCMYCMSNLTSAVVVVGWSTKQSKQSKANINRILPQINHKMLVLMFTLALASFLYLNRGRNHTYLRLN